MTQIRLLEAIHEPARRTRGVRVLFDPLERWLNRDLPPDRAIRLRIAWPLLLIPLLLFNQLLAPHVVWMTLSVTLVGLYVVALFWVRSQAPAVELLRARLSSTLVAGDELEEEFELRNNGRLPVLWAELSDASTVPGYAPGRVVACEAQGLYRWRSSTVCEVRGVFRLGPHTLRLQDPFGLFEIVVHDGLSDTLIIYPRVVELPHVTLPHGDIQGSDRRQRPMPGPMPAATVTEYRPGDSLRYIHWPSTAHRGRFMVKDLELEPSGDIWLILDLDKDVQRGSGLGGTLEQAVIVTASLAAELLLGRDHRAVGLQAYGTVDDDTEQLVYVNSTVGQGHIWRILAALAPVQAGSLPLSGILERGRSGMAPRSTVLVVTAALTVQAENNWIAQLAQLQASGVAASVVLVLGAGEETDRADETRRLLANLNIPATVVSALTAQPGLLRFRRRKTVLRTTPTGGVVRYEVEDDGGEVQLW